MGEEDYVVGWRNAATQNLGEIYNADHEKVYDRAKIILSRNPHKNAIGKACYPGFKFNGYKWTELYNVIFVYKIDEQNRKVSIEASYSALTGFAQRIFYGEDDPYYE